MILSVSRRTDIPAFYMEWFINRLREREVWVRNPVNPRQVSRISLEQNKIDGIVFWSKSPAPLLDYVQELAPFPWYLQFTLTGYGRDLEPGLPDKRKSLIPLFQRLAETAGEKRMVWRYDPILRSEKYSFAYHEKAFRTIAGELKGCTDQVVISFLDLYAKTRRNMAGTGLREISGEEMRELAETLAAIAKENGIKAAACAEAQAGSWNGVEKGACIDRLRLERLSGCRLKARKDKGQREECGCMESVDVGAYDTCPAGCRYCYASQGPGQAKEHMGRLRLDSHLLCSELGIRDSLTVRRTVSFRQKTDLLEEGFLQT